MYMYVHVYTNRMYICVHAHVYIDPKYGTCTINVICIYVYVYAHVYRS